MALNIDVATLQTDTLAVIAMLVVVVPVAISSLAVIYFKIQPDIQRLKTAASAHSEVIVQNQIAIKKLEHATDGSPTLPDHPVVVDPGLSGPRPGDVGPGPQ